MSNESKEQKREAIQLSEHIDPNVNFDGALAAALRRKQAQEADQARDDSGEPTEQEGTGSRRPLAEQILEEQRAEQTPDPPRNDLGQFAAKPAGDLGRFAASPQTEEIQPAGEAPFEPEPEPEPETPAETAERLLAGKFKDPAELERAYTELEQQQGRSSGEMNELRGRVEELSRRLSTPPAPQPLVQPALSPDQIDAGLDTGGVDFLATLYEAEHPSYESALDRLYEVAPRIAGQWQADVAAWEASRELRADLTPQIAAVASPVTRNESQNRWNDTWRTLAAENPEMNVLAEVMMSDLEANQHLTLPIKEGLPGAERMVLENLLARARDANRGKIAEAVTKQDEEVSAEKIGAQVVHASAGAARTGGEGEAQAEAIQGLKSRILRDQAGQNIHEEIARSARG